MYDAIILAGGENSKEMCQHTPQSYEALIDIAGKPMVTFVAEALATSGQVDRIFVLGPTAELASCEFPPGTTICEGGPTIIETIRIGMHHLGHNRPVLVATADIPLLTAEAVTDFLAQCGRVEADLYYPIVPKEVNERSFPATSARMSVCAKAFSRAANCFSSSRILSNSVPWWRRSSSPNASTRLCFAVCWAGRSCSAFLSGALPGGCSAAGCRNCCVCGERSSNRLTPNWASMSISERP
jgi:GTP:adenosylcobinamide-phosphate guanylyltransferase